MPVSRRDHRTLEAHPQLRSPGPDGSVEYGKSVEAIGTERQWLDPNDRAKVKIAVKVWKQAPPREGSHFSRSPSLAASTCTRRRSSWPAKCFLAVSMTCAVVEKWMKPSRRSPPSRKRRLRVRP